VIRVQASRREILEAGHRLFVERGYVATSIPAIAAEAGVAGRPRRGAAALEQTLADGRFSRYREAARELARRGGLHAGVTPDQAAAT